MTTINDIDNFFNIHPLKEAYFSFNESDRKGAMAVAQRDVMAALNYAEIQNSILETVTAAIAEQSVYLLLNPTVLTGAADIIARENSAGNQRVYRERLTPLCIRAAALLKPLLENMSSDTDGTQPDNDDNDNGGNNGSNNNSNSNNLQPQILPTLTLSRG